MIGTLADAARHPPRLFLGLTPSRRDKKLKVAAKAIDKLKDRVRQLSPRTRGHKVEKIVKKLRTSLLCWNPTSASPKCAASLRISKTVALALAMPTKYFRNLGLPSLAEASV